MKRSESIDRARAGLRRYLKESRERIEAKRELRARLIEKPVRRTTDDDSTDLR
jgi:hypothetical protein